MLLLFALARPIASSISAVSSNETTPFDTTTSECVDINECRSITDIVWSCLSVIFICTWVAIHPNIPILRKKQTQEWHPAVVLYQNVELMIIALFVPEFMILWAMRQREKAKEIREKFKQYGWGMTHGFFVIMGGFALFDGDDFCGYLWDDSQGDKSEGLERWKGEIGEQHEYVQKGPSNSPRTDHIQDAKSNTQLVSEKMINAPSDGSCLLEFLVAKGYVNITENEIKDRSHADFISKSIAVIQTTWFILQVIARAVEGLAITEIEIITVGFALLNFGTYFLWWNKPLRVGYPVRVYWRQKDRCAVQSNEDTAWRMCKEGIVAVIDYIYATNFSDRIPDTLFFRCLLFPVLIPWHTFLTCWILLQDEDDNHSYLAMPISSRLRKDPLLVYIIVYGIAALFGCVHCIPWAFHFPTHTEQLLWRISAVGIAAAPIAMGILHGYLSSDMDVAYWVFVTVPVVLSLAYVVFRVVLIVVALMALRDIPLSGYRTVQWTTFIPHIG